MSQNDGLNPAGHGWFTTTHWSVVLAAKAAESPQAQGALEQLCRTYWYPLYGYLRRRGYQPADAEDLVQGLFAKLLARDFLKDITPEKGRFRSFLLTCLHHYLADQTDRALSQKRGSGTPPLSLDAISAENRYLKESVQGEDPETFFGRQWALSAMESTLDRLGVEEADKGKGGLFAQLRGALAAENGTPPYAEVAQHFGLSEGTVASTVHRLRQRCRELFREQIAHTVSQPEDVDEEIQYLFRALGT